MLTCTCIAVKTCIRVFICCLEARLCGIVVKPFSEAIQPGFYHRLIESFWMRLELIIELYMNKAVDRILQPNSHMVKVYTSANLNCNVCFNQS